MTNVTKLRPKLLGAKSVTLLSLLLLAGCGPVIRRRLHNAGPAEAAIAIERNLDYLSKGLRIGMPKAEALALLPKPQNTNVENVCVWVLPSTGMQGSPRLDWQSLCSTRGGFFVVFVNDTLATPVCANAAFEPWQALQRWAGLGEAQAKTLLPAAPAPPAAPRAVQEPK